MSHVPTRRVRAARSGRHRSLAALALVCFAGAAAAEYLSSGDGRPGDGAPLDLSRYAPSFGDSFDTLDVSANGRPERTAWTAHTPWGGDFGDAQFADPGPDSPFSVAEGVLTIEARRGADGKWRSGLLSAMDPQGHGFAQRGGYFEARMKLPSGPGTWPAFWLIGTDRERYTAEIDVIEHYGAMPDRYTSVWHVWREHLDGGDNDKAFRQHPIEPGSLYDDFHNYGVEILDDELVYHFDRRAIWRVPKPDAFDGVAFYPLINLALGGGWPIDATPDPSRLLVDHVRVWRALDD